MPLLTPTHSFWSCGGNEVITSITIFFMCDAMIGLERQECYVLNIRLEFPLIIYEITVSILLLIMWQCGVWMLVIEWKENLDFLSL